MPHLSTFMMEIKLTWIRKLIHKDSKILTESTGCNVTKLFQFGSEFVSYFNKTIHFLERPPS